MLRNRSLNIELVVVGGGSVKVCKSIADWGFPFNPTP